MVKIRLFFFLLLIPFHQLSAQTDPDSLRPVPRDTTTLTDTATPNTRTDTATTIVVPPKSLSQSDSVSKRPIAGTVWQIDPAAIFNGGLNAHILSHHPWMGFSSRPEVMFAEIRVFRGKETLFYTLTGLLLLFAIIKSAFPKYFNDLFRVFFRTTLKQRQIREQLMQTPLPSLLLNGFFVLCAGLYLAFVLEHYGKNPFDTLWMLVIYCCAGIAIMYFVKFIGLRLLGSVFGVPGAATSYIFVVFIVNKMIGILLLPFLVLLAFTTGTLYKVSLNLSFVMLTLMLVYRLILTFAAIRNQIRVNPFHFMLYIAAFEIAPLLLVYRALLVYFPEIA